MKRLNNSPKGHGYEAPKVEIVEIEFQGVLCASGGAPESPTYPSSGGVHFGTKEGSWG